MQNIGLSEFEGAGLAPAAAPGSLERLTFKLLKRYVTNAIDGAEERLVRSAAAEALALAWSTGFGPLLLPVLLEEKVGSAVRYARKQRQIRGGRRFGWSL